MHGWGLILFNSKIKVGLEFSYIENVEQVTAGFYFIGHAKITYGWGFKLLEMLKYGTIGILYCSQRKYKVRLGFSFIESAEIMHCWGFNLFENLKLDMAGV